MGLPDLFSTHGGWWWKHDEHNEDTRWW
jgi:hypothetical protein